MVRSIKAVFVLSVTLWFSIAAAQQPVQLPDEPIRIADLGLEEQVPSALDLVGPDAGSAGEHRAILVHRIQCWIDGIESCSSADLNDPRVREIRRFIALGPDDRDGAVIVQFPDNTRIEIRLNRVADLNPNDWDQAVYQPVILPDTARVPGLPAIPSRPDHFDSLAYEGAPAIRAAIERLRQRF